MEDNQTSNPAENKPENTPPPPEGNTARSFEPGDPPPGRTIRPNQTGKKKWLVLGVAVVIIAVAVAAALLLTSKKTPTAQQKPLTKVNVRLEWVNNPEFAGMYVAQDKGFYKAQGLDVNLKEYDQSTDVNKEVSSGQVDYGVSSPLEVISARDKGDKTKAVAAIYQTSPYSIATLKSANIHTPADFKGKVLGNTGDNTQATVTYAVLMANAGLKPSDATIKTVDFDPLVVFQQKQAQTADLFRNDETYKLNQAGIQYDQIFPEQFGFNIYGDVLIASDSKIQQNPAQVQAFVKATLQGWQYVIDHPTEAESIQNRHYNSDYSDPAYRKYVLNSTIPFIKPTGGQSLGDMQYVYWNRAFNGMKEAGLLKTDFNASDVYTNQFVR